MQKSSHKPIEVLAPAGDFASVIAAVRCGANAVYLGGTRLNARKGASTFDLPLLEKAVAYCHARNVSVHLALNTIVFDDEIDDVILSLREACTAGVDALIVHDIAVAALARIHAPSIQLHASTQLSVHSLAGVKAVAKLGFQRVVLARELSLSEIEYITENSPIEVECFIHGALCMSISGQCYLSGMIGGRSGNRGQCAQPCRLPFASEGSSHALSLKDLSQIEYLPIYQEMGVASLKIEGRLKRPEYVAAAVTACVKSRNGETPDYETLEAVFSRSGFTDGYWVGTLDDSMFGTRRREDVVSATDTFSKLQALYAQETPLVPVDFHLTIHNGKPSSLTVTDTDRHTVTAENEIPSPALTAPLSPQRARASLEKTGGTPFYLREFTSDIDSSLFLPAAILNALRRDCLESLLAMRSVITPHPFIPYHPSEPSFYHTLPPFPATRIRVSSLDQLTPEIIAKAELLILPLDLLTEASLGVLLPLRYQILLELPRFFFGDDSPIRNQLAFASQQGFANVLIGNLSGLSLVTDFDFILHGDFTLNTTNSLALEEYTTLGFTSVTMSIEYGLTKTNRPSPLPRGIIAYGYLPAMAFRNHPSGMKGKDGILTDRKGISFSVRRAGEVSLMYNSVPLSLADRQNNLRGLDFITLYFTGESPAQCNQILIDFKAGTTPESFTRGSYFSRVL